ncbi:IS701 family transposase [Streptomyces sp. B21-105]
MTAELIAEWRDELSALTGSLGHLFNRPEPRVVFAQFVEGLLAELPRKNGWTLSERAGHATADRMQWLLNGSVSDADLLRDTVRGYVVEHLGDADALLVIDDTQAQKKGTKSVGVAFQHCGLTGDVRNCQTMVMLTYAAGGGHAFLDRRLYLPEEWTSDRERCREAGVPDDVAFATKPELAIAMLTDALAAAVPFAWVLADAGYGRDPQLRAFCHERALPYVLGVPVDLPLDGPPGKPRQPAVKRADDLLHYVKVRDQWERRSCGFGAKGERLYDWTAFAVEVKDETPAEGLSHWMVLRRSPHPNRRGKDGQLHREIAYFLVHPPRHHDHLGDHRPGWPPLADRRGQRAQQAARRFRPVPGPQVDPLAPARHRMHAGHRLPRRSTRSIPRSRSRLRWHSGAVRPGKSPGHGRERGHRLTPGPLLRPSAHTIRHCLAATHLNPRHPVETVLACEYWRRLHQTRALVSHYRRRGDPLPHRLRAWAHHQPTPPITDPQDLRL